MGLWCFSDRDKELVATRQYKQVPMKVETTNDVVPGELNMGKVGTCPNLKFVAAEFERHQWTSENVLAWLRERVGSNQYSSRARHVTSSTTLTREYRDLLGYVSDVRPASCQQWWTHFPSDFGCVLDNS